ncbi:hypothetical protein [Carboxylicivirga taeanensis]|uniref:hypothetical protein n=1 Tax=Carboxylicivirga taeanensis TaxID=1416875 RepID=UPI003F6E1F06
MKNMNRLWCKGVSDKDFIFDVFKKKGFVPYTNTNQQISNPSEYADNELETDSNASPEPEK